MHKPLRDHEMVDVIGSLSSQGETGKLHITTGMTEGAVFFDKGEIVDASLGKLNGFQAINAIASIRDATFNFDPSISPPIESSITPNERILLDDFFGIGQVDREPHYFDRLKPHYFDSVSGPPNNVPAQVVPLSEVEDHTNYEDTIRDDADEVTVVNSNSRRAEQQPPIRYESISHRRFSPVVFATILTILLAAAVVALLYRFRGHSLSRQATVQAPSTANVSEAPKTEDVNSDVASFVPDLSGNWKVVNTVEQTAYQPYKNLEVGFELAINQTGSEFTGTGQKVSENGRSLAGTSRTPIVVQGSIEGDKVEATFSESGTVRKTSGRFVWRIDKASGGLTGTFASSAARSSGRSAAKKQL